MVFDFVRCGGNSLLERENRESDEWVNISEMDL